jgi:glyoxylase-like metal-dependent hydrolase (beta-lactamase superfamily II)
MPLKIPLSANTPLPWASIPLLITNGETNIVIDPGLGWGLDYNSSYQDTSNVVTNLSIFGLRPEDIHHVVLSHLHYRSLGRLLTFVDEFL